MSLISRVKQWRSPTKIELLIILIVIAVLALVNVSTKRTVKNRVNSFETALNGIGRVEGMSVNSKEIDIKQARDILATFAEPNPHHSHPLNELPVIIYGTSGTLNLIFGKDSGDPREYWVFQDGVDVGRVYTDIPLEK